MVMDMKLLLYGILSNPQYVKLLKSAFFFLVFLRLKLIVSLCFRSVADYMIVLYVLSSRPTAVNLSDAAIKLKEIISKAASTATVPGSVFQVGIHSYASSYLSLTCMILAP